MCDLGKFEFNCLQCRSSLSVPSSAEGQWIKCPHCGSDVFAKKAGPFTFSLSAARTDKHGNIIRPSPPTERQVTFLRDLGETAVPGTKEEATALISQVVNRIKYSLGNIFYNFSELERPDERRATLAVRHSDYYNDLRKDGTVTDDLKIRLIRTVQAALDPGVFQFLKIRGIRKLRSQLEDAAATGDISFSCVHCGQHLVVDQSGAGAVVPCPSCAQEITIPKLVKEAP